MGCGRIFNLINGAHRRIHSRIKSYRIIRTINIQINSSRNPNRINSEGREFLCAAERTVAADNNQAVNSVILQNLRALELAFLRFKFLASGRKQNCTAETCYLGYHFGIHIYNFII